MPGPGPRPCGALPSSPPAPFFLPTPRPRPTPGTAGRTGDRAAPFHANPFHANLFHRAATAHFFPGRAGAAEYLFHRAAARPERGCSHGGGPGPGGHPFANARGSSPNRFRSAAGGHEGTVAGATACYLSTSAADVEE